MLSVQRVIADVNGRRLTIVAAMVDRLVHHTEIINAVDTRLEC